jgi:hypothetical protein
MFTAFICQIYQNQINSDKNDLLLHKFMLKRHVVGFLINDIYKTPSTQLKI